MNTNPEWSAAPQRRTLLDVCRFVGTEDEWGTRLAAKNLDYQALRKSFPEDFNECASSASSIAYHDRPYADPDAAMLYMEASRVSRQLLERAVAMMMIEHHWKAEVRRPGVPRREQIDLELVLTLDAAIDATTLNVEGVEYLDLSFCPPSADRFEDLVNLIRDHAPRMDPRVDKIADFLREITAIVGKPVPEETLRKAMRAADVSPLWFARGRKLGTGSHEK